MSLSVTVDAMIAAGCSPEQIGAVVRAHEADRERADAERREKARSGNADRQRRLRERNACHAVTERDNALFAVTERDASPQVSPEVSPQEIYNSTPLPNPLPNPHEPRAKRASPSAEAAVIADEFSTGFWPVWPHKVGKPEAAKAFLRARRAGVTLETIIDGARRYVADKPPDRPWLNPATFLNQRRWEDVPAAMARAGPSQRPRETILTALAFGTDDEPDCTAPEPSAGPQHGSSGPAVARLFGPAGDPFEPVGADGGRTLAGFGLTRSIGG